MLYPKLDTGERWLGASLHYAISAALMLNDQSYLDELDTYTPDDKTQASLVYFGARASAYQRNRDNLFFYTRRSIELNVPISKFKEDEDIQTYINNEGFL